MSSSVHRTARISLRLTPAQQERCFGLLRAAGDAGAWVLDTNRTRTHQGLPWITDHPTWCRQLTRSGLRFGELPRQAVEGVLRRYTTACAETTRRRKAGQNARYPRRKRRLVPVRFRTGLFEIQQRRVRLSLARGAPELVVRLARPLPYPAAHVRAVTLGHEYGRLVLDVTAAVPVTPQAADPDRAAGVDLGIIHPYAVATDEGEGLLVSGRAIRAEGRLHLDDTKARAARLSRKRPARRGQAGSRRWRRLRRRQRQAEARHRRRVRQAHHEAAGEVVGFAVANHIGLLVVGDAKGICERDAGRVHNLRLRQWRRTHLLHALSDKAELHGIRVVLVDERGTSSTCPACRQRVPKPRGRNFTCTHCGHTGHRDLVGAANIAAKRGGEPHAITRVTHRRAGQAPARRDRRRHQMDTRRRSCPAPGRPHPDVGVARHPAAVQAAARGVRSPAVKDQQPRPPNEANVA